MQMVAPPRQLRIGTIIDKTLGVVEYSTAAVAIYIAGLTLLNSAIKYFTVSMGPLEQLGGGLAQFVVGITASYLVLEAMVRKTGLRSRADDDVFFAFFALSILYILGLFAGLIMLVLPGLVIMARWSLAQPMMIARGDGVMQALGGSWERTKGNEFQIIVAVLALYIVPIAIVIACSLMFDPADPIGIALTQFVSSIVSALGLAMGVALYGLMEGHRMSASPMG